MATAAANDLDSRHWRAEVEALLQAAPALTPAAREAISRVLRSLAADPTSDPETITDAGMLLEAIDAEPPHRTRELILRIGQRIAIELAA